MRTIKFRAWEKPELPDFEGNMLYDIDEYFHKWHGHKDYEIMQYTGIKDTLEKEIYEGDIVQDEEGDCFQINWSSDEARFTADLISSEGRICDSFGMQDLFGIIIGNIYENSDLIK